MVRISEDTAKALNQYLFAERPAAENASGGQPLDFLHLKGNAVGTSLAYHNYFIILKACAKRCAVDERKIRTHSGRSTRVMEVLEHNAQYLDEAKSEI